MIHHVDADDEIGVGWLCGALCAWLHYRAQRMGENISMQQGYQIRVQSFVWSSDGSGTFGVGIFGGGQLCGREMILLYYTRPSRYRSNCMAASKWRWAAGPPSVKFWFSRSQWAGDMTDYCPGRSDPSSSIVETILGGRGIGRASPVCPQT
jgi:hypothetical protein